MNTLDIVFVIILGTLCLRGIFRGMVREIASILGLVLAFVLANKFHEELLPSIQKFIATPGYARATAYLVIFFGTMIAVFVVSTLLKHFLKMIMLGWLDRLGGGGLGLAKGLLLCSVILIVLTTFLSPKTSLLSTSKVAPYIGMVNNALAGFLPDNMQDEFRSKSSSLKELWHADWMEKLKQKQEALRGNN
ncbi:CvpA family protein [Desulfoplanes formicivorans]|uniref:Colicin V production protein n=1 Tax=Desulfoplanes formicivorans TaxID=1592317 RepID=A0A194AJE5_9BACT|nr:CvpA family protein [Desulfoplanes formicivorans]GAU09360.1 colicin V production protein [Desulfoplanes formicivorans]